MSSFDEAINPLLEHEGGRLVPNDNNRGASKWGVTRKSYQELVPAATDADIAELGPEQASLFYRRMFWERYRIGLIDDQAVATKVLDLAVNVGPAPAIKILQRAIGVSPCDGVLGPKTAGVVNQYPASKVLEGIRVAGAGYYRELVDRRPEYARFLNGWLERLTS